MVSKKTIEAKFKRAGINPEKTYLWEEMKRELKAEIQNIVRLLHDEAFIICFYKSSNYFLLLTTHRIIIVENRHIIEVMYTSINEVKLNEVFSGGQTKMDNDTINIVLKSKQTIDIKVEIGTWHILYSIIKLITSQES
jgi:hypothetical protein